MVYALFGRDRKTFSRQSKFVRQSLCGGSDPAERLHSLA